LDLCSRPADLARSIGDFTRWKEHDAYSKALDRLLRDLWVEKAWPRQGRQKPVQRLFCSGAGCSDPGANRVF
jgi:hypothetical protein